MSSQLSMSCTFLRCGEQLTSCICVQRHILLYVVPVNLLHFVPFCQNGLATKVEKSRKQMKERKNRAKKIRGVKKTKAGDAGKKK